MKRILVALAITLATCLRAQAPEPMPLARGDVPGEPHHHLKIENEYVRVYYVEVPPHDETQLHQHDHDYLFVTLGDSSVINAVRDKPEVHLVLKDGETHFTRGNFAHVARNLADAPFRNVTIELLHPQVKPHNACAQVILTEPLSSVCGALVKENYSKVDQFDSDELRLDFVQLRPKANFTEADDEPAFLLVGLSGSGIKVAVHGQPANALRRGEIAWVDPASDMQISNEGSETASLYQLTFKHANAGGKN